MAQSLTYRSTLRASFLRQRSGTSSTQKPPPRVRELFRYALVLALIDDEKARVIQTREQDGRGYITVETVARDVFKMGRPELSDGLERHFERP